MRERSLARLRRHDIGFVFQAFQLMDELTAAENIELLVLLAGRSPRTARRRAAALLERVRRPERARHPQPSYERWWPAPSVRAPSMTPLPSTQMP
jgi:putative ABC transport system ATP-binding protein